MTRTTQGRASITAAHGAAETPAKQALSFVSWTPRALDQSRERAARRGEVDTSRVLGEDDARAAFARSLRAMGLHACARVMVAKAA